VPGVRARPRAGEPRTRLKQASVFSPTRLAILRAVAAEPGASMSRVARAIERHPSVVSIDVHLLRQAGLIVLEKPRGKRSASLRLPGGAR
jgi:predicted transcriptional regulator